jgi:alpha-1,6-mannosyltransferase
MRIVDVSAFYAPQGGGVKTYVERKLIAAAEAGHELVVIAPGEIDAFHEIVPGGILASIASPILPFDRRYRYFGNEAALHRAISSWRPDMVEASSPWSSASMVARWPGGAPRSLVMHADPLSAYAYRWFGRIASIATIDRRFDRFWQHLRRLDADFDRVVCASADLTRRLKAGGLRGPITIPMGVEPGVFSPSLRDGCLRADMLARCGLDSAATLIVGVGRYSPEKRWGMVIDAAMAAGMAVPVGLVLIGGGRSRRALITQASGCPHVIVGEAIRDRGALATVMASADAVVHGCEAETFCMVAAEARASGTPVIVPDRGGAADHATGAPSVQYAAASGDALRDAIMAFSDQRFAPRVDRLQHRVRMMDEHFSDLFALYGDLRIPLPRAA